jgi:hypothetical protein
MSKLRLDTLTVTTFATTTRSVHARTTGSPACPISYGGTCWVTCWETCYCETAFEC